MSESLSQGLPFLDLNQQGLRLYKSNDISFANLKEAGYNCNKSPKKPDQFVAYGKNILIGIEDKKSSSEIEEAKKQLKTNYLDALPETKYFIARAGERTKVFFRIASNKLIEIGTTLKGKEVLCFAARIITGENKEIQKNLLLLSEQVLAGKEPINGSIEIQPPKDYYNPLIVKQTTIYNLWQKIFVCTGENALKCLETFIELLLFKGISDAKLLPKDFSIETLADPNKSKSLETYKNVVRNYIKTSIFPTISNQPGVINGFAFEDEETVFKTVLKDLIGLGNIAQKQIDPDFKRRIIEAFLGSAHREGTIKSGKHLTPRVIIQAIWEMADPPEGKRICDPACGVGGFVLEGLNYPYEFDPVKYDCFGIDRDEQMIITAKANMILHILDKFRDPSYNSKILAEKINSTFYQAKNNGTGTLGELVEIPDKETEFQPKHLADYVFSNVPFYINGVKQIDNSLKDLGFSSYYEACGLGVESRFVKYVLGQIKNGEPGLAFVIVTDGIFYRHKDRIRQTIKDNADVLGIISLPEGVFQNNNWKTSILIFKRKEARPEFSPVFLYNIDNIGISLDAYRTPTEENDLPNMKRAWQKRLSGDIIDPKCKLISREKFLKVDKWSDLFSEWRKVDNNNKISFSEFIESASDVNSDISKMLNEADKKIGEIFAMDRYMEIELSNEFYFRVTTPSFKATVKHARLNPGKYPLFSSQVNGPIQYMADKKAPPILIENETKGEKKKLISWNIKGDPCKDIRVHDTPFYATENRGLIFIANEEIDFYYVLYYLREHLVVSGKFKRSNEAHAGKVRRIKIKVPIDDRGNIDLAKQKDIAKNYEKIIDLRKNVVDRLSELQSLVSDIDVFK
jgi:type I restriction enzyme M protein